MKKALLIIFSVVLLLALCIGARLFLIGEPVDGAQLAYTITEAGKELHLDVGTPASAIALRGWKFRQEGSSLYISCRKVLVSPFFSSGTYQTTIDAALLDEVYLGGKLIWPAE